MFCYTLHLDCLRFHTQRCCRFLSRKVAKKKIQESVHSEEYYQEDNKIGKKGGHFFRDIRFISGTVAENPGGMATISLISGTP